MTDLVAHQFLNYKGRLRTIVGKTLGPNQWGEMLIAVSATYDQDTDRTRVGVVLYEDFFATDVEELYAEDDADEPEGLQLLHVGE